MNHLLPGTRALRTFEAAARHLNFTRAAEEVGLTPAAVSHQIKDIENQLGIELFSRTGRSIQLTPAGAAVFEATAVALETLRSAVNSARKLARKSSQLRISMGARLATSWFLPRLPRFRAAHPTLELTFDITDQLRDFDTDDVDVAIRFGAGKYERTQSLRLFDTEVVCVCSPQLFESDARPEHPRDLFRHTLCHVDCSIEGMVWPDWSMWMAAAGIEDFDASRCVAFSDSNHVVQAVMKSNAVGLVELAMIANDLAEGRLVRLFDIGVSVAPDFAYYLVYPESGREDTRVRALREWLLAEARQPTGTPRIGP